MNKNYFEKYKKWFGLYGYIVVIMSIGYVPLSVYDICPYFRKVVIYIYFGYIAALIYGLPYLKRQSFGMRYVWTIPVFPMIGYWIASIR